MGSPVFMATVVHQFYQVLASHAAMGFLLHIAQHRLLLINLMMWEWLEGVIEESQNAAHWLHSLHLQAEIMVNAMPQTITELHTNNYIPGLASAQPIFRHVALHSKCRYDLDGSQNRVQDIDNLLENILVQWFDFPAERNLRSQALFVQEIVDAMGCDA